MQLQKQLTILTKVTGSPLPVQTGTQTTTAVWKTYINNDWGITFQYPAASNATLPNLSPIILKETSDSITLTSPPDWGLSFTRIKNSTIEQVVSEVTAKMNKSMPNESKDLGIKKINGYDNRQLLFRFDQGDTYVLLLQKGNDVIEIYTGFSLFGTGNSLIDQILSTFQFLN